MYDRVNCYPSDQAYGKDPTAGWRAHLPFGVFQPSSRLDAVADEELLVAPSVRPL